MKGIIAWTMFLAVAGLFTWVAIRAPSPRGMVPASDAQEQRNESQPSRTYSKKVDLSLTEAWSETIWLAAGESIHIWGNPNVVGQSEGNDWVEYVPSTVARNQNLFGVSYWFRFRAKEGTGRMTYCVYSKAENPNDVCR